MQTNQPQTSGTSTEKTPQQHHTKAAEYFEQAAKAHKEAARLIGSNDQSGAQAQIKIAQEQASKGQECASRLAKSRPPAPPLPPAVNDGLMADAMNRLLRKQQAVFLGKGLFLR